MFRKVNTKRKYLLLGHKSLWGGVVRGARAGAEGPGFESWHRTCVKNGVTCVSSSGASLEIKNIFAIFYAKNGVTCVSSGGASLEIKNIFAIFYAIFQF